MRVTTTTSGDFTNITRWLNSAKSKSPTTVLRKVGDEGVVALSAATPRVDTGATAAGWRHKIEQTSKGAELVFVNIAHPHTSVSIAMIIDRGHGTRTGGYVPARPYIRQTMRPLLDNAADRIAREMFK